MAGRRNCRGTATACTRVVREAEEGEVRQEMPMCRHVHPLPTDGGTERQLCELLQLTCEQNRMLGELLQVMRGRNG